jgi:hypothetical protein
MAPCNFPVFGCIQVANAHRERRLLGRGYTGA